MSKFLSMLILIALTGGVIANFKPEIKAFYNDTLGGCVEEAKRVAKLHEERNKEMGAILDNIN